MVFIVPPQAAAGAGHLPRVVPTTNSSSRWMAAESCARAGTQALILGSMWVTGTSVHWGRLCEASKVESRNSKFDFSVRFACSDFKLITLAPSFAGIPKPELDSGEKSSSFEFRVSPSSRAGHLARNCSRFSGRMRGLSIFGFGRNSTATSAQAYTGRGAHDLDRPFAHFFSSGEPRVNFLGQIVRQLLLQQAGAGEHQEAVGARHLQNRDASRHRHMGAGGKGLGMARL